MTIRIDDRAVRRALEKLEPRQRTKAILTGEREGAKLLKAEVKAAVPPQMKRMVRAVYQGTARRDKPGAFVAIRGGKKGQAAAKNRAFYRAWVIGGTQDRVQKKTSRKTGRMTANPLVERVARASGPQAVKVAVAAIIRALGL